jgi:hypothetical protein
MTRKSPSRDSSSRRRRTHDNARDNLEGDNGSIASSARAFLTLPNASRTHHCRMPRDEINMNPETASRPLHASSSSFSDSSREPEELSAISIAHVIKFFPSHQRSPSPPPRRVSILGIKHLDESRLELRFY